MSMTYMVGGRKVFTTSNGALYTIYSTFDELAYSEKVVLNSELHRMGEVIEDLNGLLPYFDIADFVHTSHGMNIFLPVFFKTLDKVKHEFSEYTISNLVLYYKIMVEYRDWLLSNGY